MKPLAIRSLSLACGLVMLQACSPAPETTAPPTPVRTAQAAPGPGQPQMAASGVLVPRDELRLAFKVGGIISRIHVQAGQAVKAGQVLAEIERTEVEAGIAQARAAAEKARRDLARGEALHADQVIPLEQLQNLRTQAEIASAQLRAAEYNAGHARLVAPTDAVVLRRLAEERDLVPPGQVVLVLGSRASGLAVRAAVSDRDVTRLSIGDRVEVRVDAAPEAVHAATLTEIAGAASERTGLFEIEAQLEPTVDAATGDATLRAGMVARLTLHPARDAGQLVHVPISAIVEADGGRASVFVLRDDKAVAREVEVAFIDADSVALRSGLEAGETVITAGAPYLRDGDVVKVTP